MEINIKLKNNIQVRNKKVLYAAIIGFISFFFPWINHVYSTVSYSGYDLFSYNLDRGGLLSWLLALLPISYILIVLIMLGIFKKIKPWKTIIIKIIPVIFVIFFLSTIIGEFDGKLTKEYDGGAMGESIFGVFRIGFILTLITSLIVAFASFKKGVSNSPKIDTSKV